MSLRAADRDKVFPHARSEALPQPDKAMHAHKTYHSNAAPYGIDLGHVFLDNIGGMALACRHNLYTSRNRPRHKPRMIVARAYPLRPLYVEGSCQPFVLPSPEGNHFGSGNIRELRVSYT